MRSIWNSNGGHRRRKLFDLAHLAQAPLAADAVQRTDAIFDADRTINGLPVEQRLAVRRYQVAPLVAELDPGRVDLAFECRGALELLP